MLIRSARSNSIKRPCTALVCSLDKSRLLWSTLPRFLSGIYFEMSNKSRRDREAKTLDKQSWSNQALVK